MYNEEEYNAMNIEKQLFDSRTIMLNGEINQTSADIVCQKLMALDMVSNDPIWLYVSSGGGSVYDGFKIMDIIDRISSPVYTVGMGIVASMATMIVSYGTKSFLTPRTRYMIHQPSSIGGKGGNAAWFKIESEQLDQIKEEMLDLYNKKTGMSKEELDKMITYDKWLTAKEALDFHFVDELLEPIEKKIPEEVK